MRQMRAGLLALVAGLLAGCLPEVRHRASMEPPALPEAPRIEIAPDLVCLDVAVIERPLGDDSLDTELWMAGNEQVVGLEKLAALEDDGLRVCRLGSPLPGKLLSLLNSRATCAGPRRLRDRLGKVVNLPIGPQRRRLAFTVQGADGPRAVALADAQCLWSVQPRAGEGSAVVLRFVPAVKHGVARTRPKAETSPEGPLRWALEPGQARDDFPQLAFELALEPGEYVAIGPRLEQKRSLGATWFSGDGKQRLLVLRASILPVEKREKDEGPVAPVVQRKGDARSIFVRRFGFSR